MLRPPERTSAVPPPGLAQKAQAPEQLVLQVLVLTLQLASVQQLPAQKPYRQFQLEE